MHVLVNWQLRRAVQFSIQAVTFWYCYGYRYYYCHELNNNIAQLHVAMSNICLVVAEFPSNKIMD